MEKITILWADDEIDSLRAQILFLKNKGYEVVTVSNGHDAIEECQQNNTIDVVFLDESMPGIGGLETLARLKAIFPHLPVVMITKNEAEHVMEEAIGSQIADYLLKPVNPMQVLTTLRKIVDKERLVRDKTATDYRQEFRNIFMAINNGLDCQEWVEVYRKIIYWELQLDRTNTEEMSEILANQKNEANAEFSKFVAAEYVDWFKKPDTAPTFSHQLLQRKVFPQMATDVPSVMVLLDNLRFDQWKSIEPIVAEHFRIEEEDFFFSLLPTATQYSRNAIFAGLTPAEIEKRFPDLWLNDNEEGGKNMHEGTFLSDQIKRLVKRPLKHEYIKVVNAAQGRQLEDNMLNYLHNDFTVIVYNFIDMLSHARTEMEVLKELASDEKAYRDLTRTWFLNSPLWTALKKAAERDIQLFITTDHGTIRVNTPSRVIGDRETTTNLRYKMGRNLQYEKRDVLEIRNPKEVGLPSPNVSSAYIFAKEDHFFLYPNNYTHYNNYYRNTFQHGGISLEEMIVPIIRLRSK
jgi:CheY-like chemotaxis protein